jgi:dephospho-CoA kinase
MVARMIVIGLTGGIGMGKTTLAAQFARLGAKICSADAIVHKLLSKGGAAVEPVGREFPGTVKNGAVDRKALGEMVFADKKKLKTLENLLHPLVVAEENAFIEKARRKGAKLVVLDIPLLFETAAEKRFHATALASAPHFLQRQRVLRRPHMTAEKFDRILASQMADRLKRRRADMVILTGLGKGYSFRKIAEMVRMLRNA